MDASYPDAASLNTSSAMCWPGKSNHQQCIAGLVDAHQPGRAPPGIHNAQVAELEVKRQEVFGSQNSKFAALVGCAAWAAAPPAARENGQRST